MHNHRSRIRGHPFFVSTSFPLFTSLTALTRERARHLRGRAFMFAEARGARCYLKRHRHLEIARYARLVSRAACQFFFSFSSLCNCCCFLWAFSVFSHRCRSVFDGKAPRPVQGFETYHTQREEERVRRPPLLAKLLSRFQVQCDSAAVHPREMNFGVSAVRELRQRRPVFFERFPS